MAGVPWVMLGWPAPVGGVGAVVVVGVVVCVAGVVGLGVVVCVPVIPGVVVVVLGWVPVCPV